MTHCKDALKRSVTSTFSEDKDHLLVSANTQCDIKAHQLNSNREQYRQSFWRTEISCHMWRLGQLLVHSYTLICWSIWEIWSIISNILEILCMCKTLLCWIYCKLKKNFIKVMIYLRIFLKCFSRNTCSPQKLIYWILLTEERDNLLFETTEAHLG